MVPVLDAAPDPVTLYGSGHEAEVDDYCSSPLREWIVRLRTELTREKIAAELWSALGLLGDLRRNLIGFDLARSHPLQIGKNERLGHYRKTLRDLTQTQLAKQFKVTKSTVSRWLWGQRDAPEPFLSHLEELENERYTRAGVRADCLWLALCDDPVDDPETVDLRLVQLYEFGSEAMVTPEDLLNLAGPLTPQAIARIKER